MRQNAWLNLASYKAHRHRTGTNWVHTQTSIPHRVITIMLVIQSKLFLWPIWAQCRRPFRTDLVLVQRFEGKFEPSRVALPVVHTFGTFVSRSADPCIGLGGPRTPLWLFCLSVRLCLFSKNWWRGGSFFLRWCEHIFVADSPRLCCGRQERFWYWWARGLGID